MASSSLFASSLKDHEEVYKVIARPIKAALKQWARAFHHITKRRRHNIIVGGTPRAEPILEKPDAFFLKKLLRNCSETLSWKFS